MYSLQKVEAGWGHRAGMTADLTPAEPETKNDEGGGWGLADDLGHESFGTVQFDLDFAEAEIWGAESSTLEGEAFFITDLPPCRGFGRVGVLGQGLGWKMFEFCGVQFEASIIQPSLETRTGGLSGRSPFRRRERKQSS